MDSVRELAAKVEAEESQYWMPDNLIIKESWRFLR
jgi:hypothetical protein